MDRPLVNWLGSVSSDPYAFVMGAFPWGEPGRLEKFSGPEPWQTDILNLIRDGLPLNFAIRIAVASGNGIGKSALIAWIILWAMSTRPHTLGVVTANTEPQLRTKTWTQLGKWHGLFIAKDLFKLTATSLFHQEHERTWRCDGIPWNENNPDAFSGLHNQGRRAFMLYDEAAGISDVIWEKSEGFTTDVDTEILWCAFGNPTRNTGRFRECFHGGRFEDLWQTRQIDTRSVALSNKQEIQRRIDAYGGENSDHVRIHVLGQFPHTGEREFFIAADVELAMSREAQCSPYDPLTLGVDVARYGANTSVIYPRKGRDGRTYERRRYQGVSTTTLAQKVFETNFELHADGIFIDGGGVGGGVVDNVRQQHLFCYEVQFGAKDDTPHIVWGSDGERYANKRSGMYGACRAWLRGGAIPNDVNLKRTMLAITYTLNLRGEIQLDKKEDIADKLGEDGALDDLDALVLTFAHALAPHEQAGGEHLRKPLVESDYDPTEWYEKEVRAA